MEWNNNFNQEELEYYYTEKYLNGGYKGYIIKGFNVSKLYQEQRINKVLKHLIVNRSETILDLGCGDGKVSEFLRDCNSKYIGLDIAQSAFPKENLKNRRFIKCNIESLPFRDNSINKIICTNLPQVFFDVWHTTFKSFQLAV